MVNVPMALARCNRCSTVPSSDRSTWPISRPCCNKPESARSSRSPSGPSSATSRPARMPSTRPRKTSRARPNCRSWEPIRAQCSGAKKRSTPRSKRSRPIWPR
uniref:(northern house mosquito) hypothetical protein n=1 Tax=Culex pipiens TaxID=7175 RepID=A0A8D8FXJ6_CULPI